MENRHRIALVTIAAVGMLAGGIVSCDYLIDRSNESSRAKRAGVSLATYKEYSAILPEHNMELFVELLDNVGVTPSLFQDHLALDPNLSPSTVSRFHRQGGTIEILTSIYEKEAPLPEGLLSDVAWWLQEYGFCWSDYPTWQERGFGLLTVSSCVRHNTSLEQAASWRDAGYGESPFWILQKAGYSPADSTEINAWTKNRFSFKEFVFAKRAGIPLDVATAWRPEYSLEEMSERITTERFLDDYRSAL